MPKKSKKKMSRSFEEKKISSGNSSSDTSGNSTGEPDELQEAYFPGTREYEYMQQAYEAERRAVHMENVYVDENDKIRVIKNDKNKNDDNEHEIKYEVHDVGKRKYRRQMSKDVHTAEVREIVKDGIDKTVPKRNMEKAIYDDGINSDEFGRAVISEYKPDLYEAMHTDNNNDGEVDEDDILPGMRRMSKYM